MQIFNFFYLLIPIIFSESSDLTENHFYSFLQVTNSDLQKVNDDNSAQTIQGKIRINDIMYNTICDCSGGSIEDHPETVQCDPSQMKIHQDKPGEGASFDTVRKLIGSPSDLTYVNVAESHFSCIDGRVNEGILGTPGGDAGEFILALHIYEDMLGFNRQLTQDAVDRFLTAYLKWMKQDKFYMCTDDDAINHLEADSGLQVNIDLLRNPSEANKKDLIEFLMKPDNTGCSHIKRMLRMPDFYSIRIEIVQMFLKAYYKIMWDRENPLRARLLLDRLVGDHQEGAFLEVRSNEACKTAQIAPLIKPKSEGQMLFVNHIDAASIRRMQLAKFFVNEINHHQEPIDIDTMHHRMNKHGLSFLEVTGSYIAKNLPFYTLNFV